MPAQVKDTPICACTGIRKQFQDITVLHGVDVAMYPAEVVALLGPNGAGKTTLLRILCRLLAADSGVLQHHLPLGYVPQQAIVWQDLTCNEQLILLARAHHLGRKQALHRASTLLSAVGLEAQAHIRAKVLSGGMKRRLAIALALVADPPLLVLDEPFTGLDPGGRIVLRRLISDLKAWGKSILLSTHLLDEAECNGDRIILLHQGRVAAVGTPHQVRARLPFHDVVTVRCDAAAVPLAIRERFVAEGGRVSPDQREVWVRTKDAAVFVAALAPFLEAGAAAGLSLAVCPASLEDAFLSLTGAGAEP